jgi:hypothetical protein
VTSPVRAVDRLAQRDRLEHHRHEADLDRLLLVTGPAVEALARIGPDALSLLEQAVDAFASCCQPLASSVIERRMSAASAWSKPPAAADARA